jgi:hypothetical protein
MIIMIIVSIFMNFSLDGCRLWKEISYSLVHVKAC